MSTKSEAVKHLSNDLGVPLPAFMSSTVPNSWANNTMSHRVPKDIIPRIIRDNRALWQPPVMEFTMTSEGEHVSYNPNYPSNSSQISAEVTGELNIRIDLVEDVSSLSEGEVVYLLLKDLQNSIINNDILRDINEDAEGIRLNDLEEWNLGILGVLSTECRTWVDAPWIIAEFYFYRRIVEIFSPFIERNEKFDMFEKQKQDGLLESLDSCDLNCAKLYDPCLSTMNIREKLKIAITLSLWGNRKDLSLWPANISSSSASGGVSESVVVADSSTDTDSTVIAQFILDNNIPEAIEHLVANSSTNETVDIIVDNAGYELFTDLHLGYTLIKHNIAKRIVFHVKGHPTFVSDVTFYDVDYTLSKLKSSTCECTRSFGAECSEFIESGQFCIHADKYWCQPHAFWEMPSRIQEKLANSTLVFIKGDANYRRILGDRYWPFDTQVRDIFKYWQVPVCALRVLKSEVAIGLSESTQRTTAEKDPKYLVSGTWGVCQFYKI